MTIDQGTEYETIRWTTNCGLKIVGDTAGSKERPIIVLMHGGGQTRHSWAGAFRRLVLTGYRVISFDARGHGQSDWSPQGEYALSDRVGDLKTVLQGVAQPVALVGASLGGATALYAAASGLAVRAIVMVDIVPEPELSGIQNILSFMRRGEEGFHSLEQAADAVAAYNPDRPRPIDPSGLMKNLRRGADGRLHWHWDPRILDHSGTAQSLLRTAAQQLSAHGTLPVMVVRGLRSEVVSDAGLTAFRNLMPHLEVFDVPGAGHMVAGDRNDAFNNGVVDFLARVFPARRT